MQDVLLKYEVAKSPWLSFKYVIPLIAHHLILDYVVPTSQSMAKRTCDQRCLECPCGIWLLIVLSLNKILQSLK